MSEQTPADNKNVDDINVNKDTANGSAANESTPELKNIPLRRK